MPDEFYLRFLGAAREVGRSSLELYYRGTRLILDSGVSLGAPIEERFPLEAEGPVDALLLTHAHLDHSGYTPKQVRDNDCPIYATPPTRDISEILLIDYLNLYPKDVDKPFEHRDIMALRRKEKLVQYYAPFQIGDVEVIPFSAGHVLGSVMFLIKTEKGNILYTGDINTAGTRTLRGADTNLPEVNYLIIESTYGGNGDIHPSRKKVEKQFIENIKQTLASGGVVIIPAFALGRAQEVILTLIHYLESGALPEVPIFVDGMIREVSRIYSLYWSWLRPELQRRVRQSKKSLFEHKAIEEVRNRDEILELTEPFIVVTTSGMLQGGPVLIYLKRFGGDRRNLIYLTGYQVKGTRGRMLLDGIKEIPLQDDEKLIVEARVEFADFSAHSDQSGLISFISKLKGVREVILVHGEHSKMLDLRQKLYKRGIPTFIPSLGEKVVLG